MTTKAPPASHRPLQQKRAPVWPARAVGRNYCSSNDKTRWEADHLVFSCQDHTLRGVISFICHDHTINAISQVVLLNPQKICRVFAQVSYWFQQLTKVHFDSDVFILVYHVCTYWFASKTSSSIINFEAITLKILALPFQVAASKRSRTSGRCSLVAMLSIVHLWHPWCPWSSWHPSRLDKTPIRVDLLDKGYLKQKISHRQLSDAKKFVKITSVAISNHSSSEIALVAKQRSAPRKCLMLVNTWPPFMVNLSITS